MKPIFFPFIIAFVCLFFQACPDKYNPNPDISFKIDNKSVQKIFFYANTVDTLVTAKSFLKDNLILIDSYSFFTTPFWSDLFENNRKLNVLIYKESTLNAFSWSEIQEKDIVDKRYVLSLEELKAINYTIVYDEN